MYNIQMSILLSELSIPVAIIVVVFSVYFILLKTKGLHYTSRLVCQKCHDEFRYDWVPGGSFNAIRLGKYRYMRCPKCYKWSMFDVWHSRIKND